MKIKSSFIGSEFCPSKSNASVQVRVFYHDLSYAEITESETFPLSEFLNELLNILGLYFGFSIVSVSFIIKMIRQQQYRRRLVRRSSIRIPEVCNQLPLEVVLK